MLPDGPDALLPLGPLALALLPVPVALVAVPPLLSCVPADDPPVPTVDALTPLPTVLALSPLLPEVPDVLSPLVLVVVLLSALRTPVPSVELVCAKAVAEVAAISAAAR